MIDVLLTLIILVLIGLLVWLDWNNRKERKSLVNAIIAKDPLELAQLEVADKVEVKVNKEREDLVSTSQLSDQEFKNAIDEENKEE